MPKKKKQTARKKSAKKTTPKREAVKKARASKRTTAKRNPRRIGAAAKRSLARKMKFSAKRRKVTSTGLVMETAPLSSVERREHQDGQAGDLQGLSNRPTANAESVQELLEEGNLEDEAIQGVEKALEADQAEAEDEVPEDDAPELSG